MAYTKAEIDLWGWIPAPDMRGKPPRLPRQEIRFVVGNLHVWAPLRVLARRFRELLPKHVSRFNRRRVLRYALANQKRHRNLCREFRL